jgi:hypothetical protein
VPPQISLHVASPNRQCVPRVEVLHEQITAYRVGFNPPNKSSAPSSRKHVNPGITPTPIGATDRRQEVGLRHHCRHGRWNALATPARCGTSLPITAGISVRCRTLTMSRPGLCPVEPRSVGSDSLLLHAARDISHTLCRALLPARTPQRLGDLPRAPSKGGNFP